jgi:type III secretory pathway component EscU
MIQMMCLNVSRHCKSSQKNFFLSHVPNYFFLYKILSLLVIDFITIRIVWTVTAKSNENLVLIILSVYILFSLKNPTMERGF